MYVLRNFGFTLDIERKIYSKIKDYVWLIVNYNFLNSKLVQIYKQIRGMQLDWKKICFLIFCIKSTYFSWTHFSWRIALMNDKFSHKKPISYHLTYNFSFLFRKIEMYVSFVRSIGQLLAFNLFHELGNCLYTFGRKYPRAIFDSLESFN